MKKYHKISPFLPSRGTHVKGSTCNVVKGEGLKAFTLVEMLVSMTIFSMIMVSIVMIYALASDISAKYDITREMRQNIKSVVEDISEEVRINWIVWVANNYLDPYIFWEWTRLKLKNGSEYRIKKSDTLLNCSDIKNICSIYKYKNWLEIWPLSNSKVSFTDLSFNVTGSWAVPKVTLKFTARAAIRAWLRPWLAEKTKLIFQTTFSERALKIK